jgi:dolichol-phosphate mannosyltransferase
VSGTQKISVVVPVLNEADVLARLVEGVLDALGSENVELIFVNDGSTDATAQTLDHIAASEPRVCAVHLARNFGHQAAILAGLRHARGDAVIVMDADLQDDPAALPAFVAKWREGNDVVYALRHGRKENIFKRALFYTFYRMLNAVTDTPLPNDAGNFGLISRRVCDLMCVAAERDRYHPGLRGWVGLRQEGLPVERGERYDDRPRVSFVGLLRLARTALFSFSSVPLMAFYVLALLSGAVFLWLLGFTLYHRLFTGLAIPGWASTIMTACFFGGLNSLGIAILGEYVTRIYDQVRGRPAFVVDRLVNLQGEHDATANDRGPGPAR